MRPSLTGRNSVRDGRGVLFAISKSTGFNYISVWLRTEKEIEKLKVKRNKIIFFGVKNIIPV